MLDRAPELPKLAMPEPPMQQGPMRRFMVRAQGSPGEWFRCHVFSLAIMMGGPTSTDFVSSAAASPPPPPLNLSLSLLVHASLSCVCGVCVRPAVLWLLLLRACSLPRPSPRCSFARQHHRHIDVHHLQLSAQQHSPAVPARGQQVNTPQTPTAPAVQRPPPPPGH